MQARGVGDSGSLVLGGSDSSWWLRWTRASRWAPVRGACEDPVCRTQCAGPGGRSRCAGASLKARKAAARPLVVSSGVDGLPLTQWVRVWEEQVGFSPRLYRTCTAGYVQKLPWR